MRWLWRLVWLACMAATGGLSVVMVRSICGSLSTHDMIAGWTVAALNGLTTFMVSGSAVGKSWEVFMRRGFVWNGIRLLALLLIVAGYWLIFPENFATFALTVVSGVLVFMLGGVVALHVGSARKSSPDEKRGV